MKKVGRPKLTNPSYSTLRKRKYRAKPTQWDLFFKKVVAGWHNFLKSPFKGGIK
jgi:hypothetical protein